MSDEKQETLRLRGQSHRLNAMPVDGTKWVGMIAINSPTDSALLTPEDAVALRDWLNVAIENGPPAEIPCGCGHSDQMHTEWIMVDGVEVGIECMVADCHEGVWVAP